MSELLKYFKGDELAANVWKSKYALPAEQAPPEMFSRMAKEFERIDSKYRMWEDRRGKELSEYGASRTDLNEQAVYGLLDDFKYVIPQGSIMATLGSSMIASLSNCWVAESPIDSYGGILKTDSDLVYYYKRRGGVGTDLSNLRPNGTPTNNTSRSSTGAVSFMHRFSNTTREVAMNGRRGALMLSIDVRHPDVLDFIKVKRDGTSVTGANISVRLNREFMHAVKTDSDYLLSWPCNIEPLEDYEEVIGDLEYDVLTKAFDKYNGEFYLKKVKAKAIWDELIHSAKNYAEPGLMYWDNVIDNDPAAVYPQFTPTCSNPCGEQFLNPNDSCRLMVLNLFSFVENPFTPQAKIDYEKLYEIAYEFARLRDNLVDLELEYIQRIINKIKSDPEPEEIKNGELLLWEKSYQKTKAGRRVGLGITALADMLAALDLKYDSDEGMQVIEQVMKTKMQAELDCSIDLSLLRGSFSGWSFNIEYIDATPAGLDIVGSNDFYHMLITDFNPQFQRMMKFGRRNISWSTVAPTGSVSILTQTTSGCEPLFQPYYMRRKKINPNERDVRVDFVDDTGDSWQEFAVMHPKFVEWCLAKNSGNTNEFLQTLDKDTLRGLFELSPWFGATANDIDWFKRNKIQAILQKYTTNAISSTINLPSTVTEQEVSDIYFSGWELGLKGQTVYVDGSRSGVLVSSDNKKEDAFEYVDAHKRPKELECDIYNTVSKGKKWNIIVGLLQGKPYEVFAAAAFTEKQGKGVIEKTKSKTYQLRDSGGDIICENIADYMNFEEVFSTRLISTALRHRTDIKFIFEQLDSSYGDITSFSKAIARVLKKYIPDEQRRNKLTCDSCGSNNIIFEEGCNRCVDCGSSKCG